MVAETRGDGTIKSAPGKVQDAAGGVFGDSDTQARGKVNQYAGEAQSYYGEALATVRDVAADRPVTALAAAAGVGLLIGLLIGRL